MWTLHGLEMVRANLLLYQEDVQRFNEEGLDEARLLEIVGIRNNPRGSHQLDAGPLRSLLKTRKILRNMRLTVRCT